MCHIKILFSIVNIAKTFFQNKNSYVNNENLKIIFSYKYKERPKFQ